ncbi:hypothetical protein A2852_00905 [Candidatus Adlerbacteria bacterium RIFCSPHIGHO2_01_FULL_54_23]|uniref:Uncharacterized protein n=1 Tax=Candidatus Adlerbacteria bacterium RIFCSPLOWO2_01_FULL_54_16 TaxID=1797244 RepID=A0A1F4Y0G9_9BACT|nr:MAG: hypothetical protein UY84_C0001G0133 [Candidatus Adlerbacteria bacterium GW2011_GWA2_54_12]OGC79403.1 MAG: hypothetical protein A2852_00905 [Candidatus Adlerbacteria bacterium RIFCSPHIGHO2_01_FULL_54_23]OGC87381.1 MAG: hypothetical protein A3B33_01855 [Candidatus Adlerbacteria bacterium RIFCSPLOWO2_01_FULL_54_16]
MHPVSRFAIIIALVAGLSAPLHASALGFSFGGRVISIPVPCFGLPGFFGVAIIPAGRFSPFYVWGPGTIGLPPLHPGQQILGIYDLPLLCNGVPGFRIQYDGVSI